ncbi:hypothetical protein [Streptomyces scopuliridis]|uniref:hypothetical protein n=1 Tax=Streptomyces scopuliridis TaxID=452529 RepID=UPI0036B354D9
MSDRAPSLRSSLASLNLPAEAGEHLAARSALLDGTYREVAARVLAGCARCVTRPPPRTE